MTFSLNNRLILKPYVKEGLRQEKSNGLITPGQRNKLKGLEVLIGTVLLDGRHIPAGSIAYINEEVLHTQAWVNKVMTSDFITGAFIVVDLSYVECITTPDTAA
jgi:hypothetical protein